MSTLNTVCCQDCADRHGGAFITLQIGAGSTAQRTLQWLEETGKTKYDRGDRGDLLKRKENAMEKSWKGAKGTCKLRTNTLILKLKCMRT